MKRICICGIAMVVLGSLCSCNMFHESKKAEKSKAYQQVSSPKGDSLEDFFGSKGVLRFNATDINLKGSFQILNEDNSIFATIDFLSNTIIIQGKSIALSENANVEVLKNEYNFSPKEFFPELFVVQFEYISVNDGVAEVFIDKEKKIKKKISISSDLFMIEPWSEHLVGCMVDFNVKKNPIRTEMSEQAKSVGYESSEEEYIFVISKIDGDWIKIECSNICDYPCSPGGKFNGWIKWKTDGKMIVHLVYVC